MQTLRIFVLIALSLLASSCVMDRQIEVSVSRIEVGVSNHNRLPPAVAESVFRDVADQLKFVVEGPVPDSQANWLVLSARPPEKYPVDKPVLDLWIDDKNISFRSNIYGTKEDFVAAQKAAMLFEQALDKLGIQYKIYTRKTMFFGP